MSAGLYIFLVIIAIIVAIIIIVIVSMVLAPSTTSPQTTAIVDYGNQTQSPVYTVGPSTGVYSPSTTTTTYVPGTSSTQSPTTTTPTTATTTPTTTTTAIKPRQKVIADCGAFTREHGWYDISKQGVKNDYCRWLRITPSLYYFSCALAGSNDPTTDMNPAMDKLATSAHDPTSSTDFCYKPSSFTY